MDYLFIGITAVVIIALLIGMYKYYSKSTKSTPAKKLTKTTSGVPSFAHCPLCGFPLPIGENIITKVYRPMDVPDQRCVVMGCIHCFPKVEQGLRRICPVCHKEVPLSGTLIARLFNKRDGSKHVHIVGCTECHKK